MSFAHHEAIEVLQLALMELEGLFSLCLVSELLSQSLDDFVESVLEQFFKLVKRCSIGLLVQVILHFLHPASIVILELVKLVFQISQPAIKLCQMTVVDITASDRCVRLRSLQV